MSKKSEVETYFGRCRCCLTYNYLKNMWRNHKNEGEIEVYGHMVLQCFVLDWEESPIFDQICDVCINRLRDAVSFKKMIIESHNRLMLANDLNEPAIKLEIEPYHQGVQIEEIVEDEEYVMVYNAPESEEGNAEPTVTELAKDETEYQEIEYLEEEVDSESKQQQSDSDGISESDSRSVGLQSRRMAKRRKMQPITKEDDDDEEPKRKWPKKLPKAERYKTYKQYSEENLRLCMKQVRNGEMTPNEASIKYNIPKKTIAAKLRQGPKESPGLKDAIVLLKPLKVSGEPKTSIGREKPGSSKAIDDEPGNEVNPTHMDKERLHESVPTETAPVKENAIKNIIDILNKPMPLSRKRKLAELIAIEKNNCNEIVNPLIKKGNVKTKMIKERSYAKASEISADLASSIRTIETSPTIVTESTYIINTRARSLKAAASKDNNDKEIINLEKTPDQKHTMTVSSAMSERIRSKKEILDDLNEFIKLPEISITKEQKQINENYTDVVSKSHWKKAIEKQYSLTIAENTPGSSQSRDDKITVIQDDAVREPPESTKKYSKYVSEKQYTKVVIRGQPVYVPGCQTEVPEVSIKIDKEVNQGSSDEATKNQQLEPPPARRRKMAKTIDPIVEPNKLQDSKVIESEKNSNEEQEKLMKKGDEIREKTTEDREERELNRLSLIRDAAHKGWYVARPKNISEKLNTASENQQVADTNSSPNPEQDAEPKKMPKTKQYKRKKFRRGKKGNKKQEEAVLDLEDDRDTSETTLLNKGNDKQDEADEQTRPLTDRRKETNSDEATKVKKLLESEKRNEQQERNIVKLGEREKIHNISKDEVNKIKEMNQEKFQTKNESEKIDTIVESELLSVPLTSSILKILQDAVIEIKKLPKAKTFHEEEESFVELDLSETMPISIVRHTSSYFNETNAVRSQKESTITKDNMKPTEKASTVIENSLFEPTPSTSEPSKSLEMAENSEINAERSNKKISTKESTVIEDHKKPTVKERKVIENSLFKPTPSTSKASETFEMKDVETNENNSCTEIYAERYYLKKRSEKQSTVIKHHEKPTQKENIDIEEPLETTTSEASEKTSSKEWTVIEDHKKGPSKTSKSLETNLNDCCYEINAVISNRKSSPKGSTISEDHKKPTVKQRIVIEDKLLEPMLSTSKASESFKMTVKETNENNYCSEINAKRYYLRKRSEKQSTIIKDHEKPTQKQHIEESEKTSSKKWSVIEDRKKGTKKEYTPTVNDPLEPPSTSKAKMILEVTDKSVIKETNKIIVKDNVVIKGRNESDKEIILKKSSSKDLRENEKQNLVKIPENHKNNEKQDPKILEQSIPKENSKSSDQKKMERLISFVELKDGSDKVVNNEALNAVEMFKHRHNMKMILKYSNATVFKGYSEKGLSCNFCDQHLSARDLKEHNWEHGDVYDEVIKVDNISELVVYVDVTDLKCWFCETIIDFFTTDQFLNHLEVKHNKIVYKDIKNYFINFSFESEVFECALCPKIFKQFLLLREHMNEHYKNFICDTCSKPFINKHSLLTHAVRHLRKPYHNNEGNLEKTVSMNDSSSESVSHQAKQTVPKLKEIDSQKANPIVARRNALDEPNKSDDEPIDKIILPIITNTEGIGLVPKRESDLEANNPKKETSQIKYRPGQSLPGMSRISMNETLQIRNRHKATSTITSEAMAQVNDIPNPRDMPDVSDMPVLLDYAGNIQGNVLSTNNIVYEPSILDNDNIMYPDLPQETLPYGEYQRMDMAQNRQSFLPSQVRIQHPMNQRMPQGPGQSRFQHMQQIPTVTRRYTTAPQPNTYGGNQRIVRINNMPQNMLMPMSYQRVQPQVTVPVVIFPQSGSAGIQGGIQGAIMMPQSFQNVNRPRIVEIETQMPNFNHSIESNNVYISIPDSASNNIEIIQDNVSSINPSQIIFTPNTNLLDSTPVRMSYENFPVVDSSTSRSDSRDSLPEATSTVPVPKNLEATPGVTANIINTGYKPTPKIVIEDIKTICGPNVMPVSKSNEPNVQIGSVSSNYNFSRPASRVSNSDMRPKSRNLYFEPIATTSRAECGPSSTYIEIASQTNPFNIQEVPTADTTPQATVKIETENKVEVKKKTIKKDDSDYENMPYTIKKNKILLEKHKHNLAMILKHSNATIFGGPIKGFYCCCYCNTKLADPEALKNHTYRHGDSAEFVIKLEDIYEFVVNLDITGLKCMLCLDPMQCLEELLEHLQGTHQIEIHVGLANRFIPFKFDTKHLQCAACRKKFTVFMLLREHMAEHYGNYECNVCHRPFVDKKSLDLHVMKHNDKEFKDPREKYTERLNFITFDKFPTKTKFKKCKYCTDRLMSWNALKQHEEVVHGVDIPIFGCEECDKRCDSEDGLRAHMAREHYGSTAYKCTECDAGFYTFEELKSHRALHKKSKLDRCIYCGKHFTSAALSKHIAIHAGNRSSNFFKEDSDEETEVTRKTKETNNKKSKKYVQDDNTTDSDSNTSAVSTVVDDGENTEVVEKAPRFKPETIDLTKHRDNIKTVLDYTNATLIKEFGKKGFACGFCEEQFKDPSKLKEHNLENHLNVGFEAIKVKRISDVVSKVDITDLKCRICDKMIDNLEQIMDHLNKLHYKTIHMDIKNHIIPFKFDPNSEFQRCVLCLKKFRHFKLLLEHMSTHYRNYDCTECNRTFLNRTAMYTHRYRHITGTFQCTYCPKVFDTGERRTIHEKEEHKYGNKIKKCSFCDERFTTTIEVEAHELKLHSGIQRKIATKAKPVETVTSSTKRVPSILRKSVTRSQTRKAAQNLIPSTSATTNEPVMNITITQIPEFKQIEPSNYSLNIDKENKNITIIQIPEVKQIEPNTFSLNIHKEDKNITITKIPEVKQIEITSTPSLKVKRMRRVTIDKIPEEPRIETEEREDVISPTEEGEETIAPENEEVISLAQEEREVESVTNVPEPSMPDLDDNEVSEILGSSENYDMLKHKHNIKIILQNSNATVIKGHNRDGYACNFCEQQRQVPCELKEHNLEAHMDEAEEAIKVKYVSDLIIRLDITDLKCSLCEKEIDNLEEFVAHLSEIHSKVFYQDIKSHIIPFKFNTDTLQCVVCAKDFNFFKLLSEHMSVHYRNYECNDCDRAFVNKQALQTHSYRHRSGIFKCSHCPKVFDSRPKRCTHEKVVHALGGKSRKCPHCDERFSTLESVHKHEIEVHGVKPKVYSCQACNKTYKSQSALLTHRKRFHLLEKPHQCPDCEMAFYSKLELEIHSVTHSRTRDLMCNICKKSFGTKCCLRQHMRVHSTDRRFKCITCERTFAYKSTWKVHMRVRHSIIV